MSIFKKIFGENNDLKKTIELEISGMTCSHCAVGIEKRVEAIAGVFERKVSYQDGKGTFVFDPEKTSKQEIIDTINTISNYSAKESVPSDSHKMTRKEVLPGGGDLGGAYDLIIIGGGSAAFSAAVTASELGKKSLLINGGLPIGGTCVNVGCVPSKNLIRAAESIHHASISLFSGIKPNPPEIDFGAIIRQKNELVKAMQQKKYLDVAGGIKGLTILEGWATFKNSHTVVVDGVEYTATKFLIATGSTTNIPSIAGLKETGFLTNVTLFDMEEKPESLTILGAGYIGLEIAIAYRRFGVKIRIIEFTDRILRSQTPDISAELEQHLKNEGIEFYPNYRIEKLEKSGDKILIKGRDTNNETPFEFTEQGYIVVATGTKPNTGKLGLENIGVKLDEKGFVKVNEQMQTSLPHIYAAGDCINTPAFVYTAAKEAKIASRNALSGENAKIDYTGLPWVVFTDPQVAGAGMDEQQAEKEGIPFEVSKLPLSEVPRSAAAFDTRGFIKLIRNPETDKLLGARIVAPEGGELAMELSLAIKYGITVTELAESFHPYLTLSEGIKLTAIAFHKDVAELSCCAS